MRIAGILATALAILVSFESAANTAFFPNVTVTGILYREGAFGSCMARVNLSGVDFTNAGLTGCTGAYVSLDCAGNFLSKSAGSQQYAAAQLGYVTGKSVVLVVDDTKIQNGYCTAVRIDNN